MVAPEGNEFNLAVPCPEKRKKIYEDFCNHLKEGYSERSWCYEDDEVEICYKTMLRYIADPKKQDCPPLKKVLAQSKGFKWWENLGKDLAVGKNAKGNVAAYNTMTRNICGWRDKESKEEDKSNLSTMSENDVSQAD